MTLEPQKLVQEDTEDILIKKINLYVNRETLLITRAKQTDQSMEDIVISLALTMERRYILEGKFDRIEYISTDITKIFEEEDIPYASSVRRALKDYPEYKLSIKTRLPRFIKANVEIQGLTVSQLQDRLIAENDNIKKGFDALKKSKNVIKAIERRVQAENIELDVKTVSKFNYENSDTYRETRKRIHTLVGTVGPSLTHTELGNLVKLYSEIMDNVWNNSPAVSPQLDMELANCIKMHIKFMQPFRSHKYCGDNYSYLELAKMRHRVTKYKAARMHEIPTNICQKCSNLDRDVFVEMTFVPFGTVQEEIEEEDPETHIKIIKKIVVEKKNFYQCSVCKGDKAIMHKMSYENVNSRADATIDMLDQALINNPLFFALTKWLRTLQWQKNATVKERSHDQWNHTK